MIRRLILAAALLIASGVAVAWAVEPSERLANPVLEARARAISQELRCLVCQNESIDESNAPLAHDLRLLVRRRLVAGDTDRQALNYIVARYGVFVLLDPPLAAVAGSAGAGARGGRRPAVAGAAAASRSGARADAGGECPRRGVAERARMTRFLA